MGDKWNRLLELYDEMEEDESFSKIRQPGQRLVRGDGPHSVESARVMVVGDAPGAQEVGAGRPFVGRQGRVLDDLLALAGFHRRQCFVTTVVKYRPPGHSAPSLWEQINGAEYLREEWAIIRPALTIAVGSVAHNSLRGSISSLTATRRGELHYFGKQPLDRPRTWITSQFSPAYGLRNPSLQPKMEEEWTTLWEMCKDAGGILCGYCDGISAREGVDCDNCNPGTYPEPG